jgi:hypothetical protein
LIVYRKVSFYAHLFIYSLPDQVRSVETWTCKHVRTQRTYKHVMNTKNIQSAGDENKHSQVSDNKLLNKVVQNVLCCLIVRISSGKLFHKRGMKLEKALSPITWFTRGISNWCETVERSCRTEYRFSAGLTSILVHDHESLYGPDTEI